MSILTCVMLYTFFFIPDFLVNIISTDFGKRGRLAPVPEIQFIVCCNHQQLLTRVERNGSYDSFIAHIPHLTATLLNK